MKSGLADWGNKTFSLSFLVWYIDGLHRKIGDGDFKRYLEHFSIASLVETFVDNSYHLTKHFTGYDKYITPAMKLSPKQAFRRWVALSEKVFFETI